MKFHLFLSAGFIFAAIGCVTAPADQKSRPNLLAKVLGPRFVADGWLKEADQWHINSPDRDYSIRVDPAFRYDGEPTLRFEMRPGDFWKGSKGTLSYRNELIPGGYPRLGSERFYACNILIPGDFPTEENRLVLLQWWPQTKSELGEAGRSPSLALRYVNGEFSATIRYSDLHVVKDPDSVPRKTLFKSNRLSRDKWHRFVFETSWSFRSDGLVKIWVDHTLQTTYHGPVGYDDDQAPLFKFGMYRDDTSRTYVTYFNNCREGKSLPEVGGI